MHYSASSFDEYMDRREVCISMNELENSVRSSVVSVLNPVQQEISDEVGNNIHNLKMRSIEEDPLQHSEPFSAADSWILHKVPYMLRQVNEIAYVPRLISIGPYHHGREHLKTMEVIKERYFRRLIKQTKVGAKVFVDAMRKEVEAIRNCYEGLLDHIGDDTFVKMLVLDGCFVLQLLREGDECHIELIYQTDIRNDLLLLENQLPFSLLLKLHSKIPSNMSFPLYESAIRFFKGNVLGEKIWYDNYPALTEAIKHVQHVHVLGLVHYSWLFSHEAEAKANQRRMPDSRKFISCATELDNAGINFKMKEAENLSTALDNGGINFKKKENLLDIDFLDDAKVLKIPKLMVSDDTELILRNMMAYEQFIMSRDRPTLVCEYVTFMDNLIQSGKDVQLLRDAGVIDNWLGNDEAVAQMFNKLRDFTSLSSDYFYYEKTIEKVKKHCGKTRYKWLAALKRDYFNSPWSCISFSAALLLLVLTVAQTIFAVLSYVNQ